MKIPEKILTKKVELVDTEKVKKGEYDSLFSDMKKAMKENSGIGLAANQVGKDLAIFVIDEEIARENKVPEIYINPEVTEYSRDKDEMEEGCLSIPEYYAPIHRSKKIKIKAVDEKGNKIKFKAKGLLARILQHETDHLNGTTIKDRAQ
ncbi:MAG: peptide deformylase [Candidatus Yanofskybacteria bacterium RIFCSPHIGHO2_02_FULL_41_11]|uniref:Peptide deformylase n=1 Tax=Candidatus Yanofskybacteria bacterium RIFCSPHIGHO2_02_FULL_41_11 TaxID=1802675 RepID=A0A1F8FCX3_9BACT|nr:MAG: peptide deformylase [Candidatus Yanofskybacteria bacterium RIFCSPHIGHO2_02_FULL_41_11]